MRGWHRTAWRRGAVDYLGREGDVARSCGFGAFDREGDSGEGAFWMVVGSGGGGGDDGDVWDAHFFFSSVCFVDARGNGGWRWCLIGSRR